MIILGIDPGFALMGWGIINKKEKPELIEYGCLKTSSKSENSVRLGTIFTSLQKIIKKFKPHIIVLEKLFFNTNAKTALLVGEARGVVKVCALLNKLPIFEFTPLQVKDCIVGYGRADKNQVQEMVKMTLGLDKIPKPDDAADALAIALTYCFYNKKLGAK